jgi:hypothetical protein
MDKLGGDVNWSALAADAFTAELQRIKARKAALKGKPMDATIDRLRQSKKTYLAAAVERGNADGVTWAMESAEYGELKAIADKWPDVQTCDTDDAFGPPAVFLSMFAVDPVDHESNNDFWDALGKERSDDDQYSAPYWEGFVAGALEVWEEIKEKIEG